MKKKILPFLLFSLINALPAQPVLYEGFNAKGPDSGNRTGFLTNWHMHAGEVGAVNDGLGFPGFSGEPGALLLQKKGEALAQIGIDLTGTFYGSFRLRTANLSKDSILGLVFAKPDLADLSPKTGKLSLLVKGWRSEHGVVISNRKSEKTEMGAPIEAREAYLVLFKVENPDQGRSTAEMWILNPAQSAYFGARGLDEGLLNQAELGTGESAVMQRLKLEAKKNMKIEFAKGDLLLCAAKFNPKVVFDEIGLSKKSLVEAAGWNGGTASTGAAMIEKSSPPVASASPVAPASDKTIRFDPAKPDIVFIILDDLRWDAMSFLDHPYVETPQIDTLRSKGAWMKNAFVSTSICCPSRATFLTGTYASRHGVIDNETSEYNPDITPPVSKYLQQAGYRTAMIGKWHMGHTGKPRPFFDEWLSFDGQGKYYDPEFIYTDGSREIVKGYTTDLLTDRAIDFINRQTADEQPFFLMLSHKAVHEPFQPAPRHKTAYGASTKDPEPVSWRDTFEGKPAWQRRQRTRDVRWNWRTRDIEAENLPDAIPPEPWAERKKFVDQLRCLASVDDGVGRLMEVLEKRGNLDNTLIIFTSDNGYFHMEHRRWDKRLAYEESLRIPMICVFPGRIAPGSTVEELVSNVDFAPTVLSYAGLPMPEQMQGRSMQPLFSGEPVEWRGQVFYEYWTDLVHAIPTMKAVRTDRYKLIRYPELEDIDELYDLKNDPHEMTNLVGKDEHQDLYARMDTLLKEEAERVGWRVDVFPKNFPRIRGPLGTLMDLKVEAGQLKDLAEPSRNLPLGNVLAADDTLVFNGASSELVVPFDPDKDPSAWPYRISVEVKPEKKDGVVAVQSSPGYGFKIFVQDGRPGVAVLTKTWIPSRTVIDAPASILNTWARLDVEIDYNRLRFYVDGQLVDSKALPLPFKATTKAPLMIGAGGKNSVTDDTPNNNLKGQIRNLKIERYQPLS